MQQCVTSVVCYLSSPAGLLKLVTCSGGVHALHFDLKTNQNKSETVKVVSVESGKVDKSVEECVRWISAYFSDAFSVNKMTAPAICALSNGGENTFRSTIWRTLKNKVPSGQTVSYGQLAELSGMQKSAARAVGTAMRTNPVCLIVPCHRVVCASGAAGNYAGGSINDVKIWLLNHEGRHEA